jgi:hypothetical protein
MKTPQVQALAGMTLLGFKDERPFDRERHGGLYDRGSADSYYRRGPEPHWYPEGKSRGDRIVNLTPDEIAEYMAGYDENERNGDFKDWG